ncbi:ground-like domain protein, partial [Ancylostoma duodenale]
KKAQLRFDQSFEVIVSPGDFALASYGFGDQTCKYKERGFTAIAYATPRQYDITNTAAEAYYSSISSRDNLGATQPSLPGQRAFHTPLQVYGEGPGAGLPVGSHCTDARTGSKCCNAQLFGVMQNAYESVITRNNFNPYDMRLIARTIQFAVEEQLQMSFETIVSTDDFAFSSDYSGTGVCKYRIDRYYIMAYETPVQYPIHSQFYEDSGPAIPPNCPAELDALDGAVCCDGTLQYEMTRAVDEAIMSQPEGQRNNDALARTISRNIQRRFGTTFETVVSHSDFTWQTHLYNENTCKIDTRGYHLLTVESSKAPPPPSDFFEPAPPIQFAMGQPPVPPQFPPPPQAFPPAPIGPPAVAAPPVAAPPVAAPPVAAPPVAAPPVAAPPFVPPAFAPPPVVPPGFGAGAGGGGGGGGGACFSTDTWVTTPNGKKRMDQLKVGDFVLTANLTSAYFAPMSLWIHREPDVVTKFVTIMTDYGKMLALTPRHLIFRNKCDEFYEDRVDSLPPNSQAVYAEELKVGDCVFLLYRVIA